MKKLLALLLVAVCLFSCSKDDTSNLYRVEYDTHNLSVDLPKIDIEHWTTVDVYSDHRVVVRYFYQGLQSKMVHTYYLYNNEVVSDYTISYTDNKPFKHKIVVTYWNRPLINP